MKIDVTFVIVCAVNKIYETRCLYERKKCMRHSCALKTNVQEMFISKREISASFEFTKNIRDQRCL